MKARSFFGVVLISAALLAMSAWADDGQVHDARARADYMIHCQGCHVGDGSGFDGRVPDLRHSLPLLLSVEGGRAFLVQVPGSSQANLSNLRLADTLTWMVRQFAGAESNLAFAPFTEAEIDTWRPQRLDDVVATRHALIGHLELPDSREEETAIGRTSE
ncbi:MAG: hypothetical protein RLN89_12985 [Parvibaculum sp.]